MKIIILFTKKYLYYLLEYLIIKFKNTLCLKLIILLINYTMLFWTIKIIIFSIIFIFLIHNIINFLLETLTVSKTKDLVQITEQNYKNIYDILSQSIHNQNNIKSTITNLELTKDDNVTLIDLLPNNLSTDDEMKTELANYLRQQLNN